MRNFFKNTFGNTTPGTTSSKMAEILDTDEDKIINQYKGYLSYINSVKKEMLRRGKEFLNYGRQLNAR